MCVPAPSPALLAFQYGGSCLLSNDNLVPRAFRPPAPRRRKALATRLLIEKREDSRDEVEFVHFSVTAAMLEQKLVLWGIELYYFNEWTHTPPIPQSPTHKSLGMTIKLLFLVSLLISVISCSWDPYCFLGQHCCSSLFLLAGLHWPWTWLGGWARNEFWWRENAHDPLRDEQRGQNETRQKPNKPLSGPLLFVGMGKGNKRQKIQ